MKQSHDRWARPPGGYDRLNLRWRYPGAGPLDLPALPPAPLSVIPRWLVGYRERVRAADFHKADAALHFFLDDYRFETVWSRPLKALEALTGFGAVCTPDFSFGPGWPLAAQQWQVYRARWCGCFWAAHGYPVIPAPGWSDAESLNWCFDGLPTRSVLAVSGVGVDFEVPAQRVQFVAGYRAMIERLDPTHVLAYGPLPGEVEGLAEVSVYPTRWRRIREGDHGE